MIQRNLPRLPSESYRGIVAAHWTMTIAGRRVGWLSELVHGRFREILLHALCRYRVVCPMYCVMPDHLQMLCLGLSPSADQQLMLRLLRKHAGQLLRSLGNGYEFQKQAYDHVLVATEREHEAFAALASYIAENPVRAGIVERDRLYPYTSCVVPGYPDLSVWSDDYWPKFWRIFEKLST